MLPLGFSITFPALSIAAFAIGILASVKRAKVTDSLGSYDD
jgi:hypothetical protein